MILIEVNRFTIQKCEEAMVKYNSEKEQHFPSISEYHHIINKALEEYLRR
jgi:hypothetical protein